MIIKSDNLHTLWYAGLMGQRTRRPFVWHSKYFVFMIFYRLRALKSFYFHFCNFVKKNEKINKDFAKNFARFYEKRIILGTSDIWSTNHLFQQTRVFYCKLTDFYGIHSLRVKNQKLSLTAIFLSLLFCAMAAVFAIPPRYHIALWGLVSK